MSRFITINADDIHVARVSSVQEFRDKLAGAGQPPPKPKAAASMSAVLGREPLPTLRERLR
jgi:hypothetical protein